MTALETAAADTPSADTTSADTTSAETTAPVADRCLEHLRREEAFWIHARAVLRSMDQALRAGRWISLAEATPIQERLTQECDELRAARRQLLVELAAAFGAPPETLTLERIAGRLPQPQRRQALEIRERLRLHAGAVQRLGRACATCAEYQASFLERFFSEISGSAAGGRYGPAGTMQPSAGRSLLQARG